MSSIRIAITGASGYIGRRLIAAANSHNVEILAFVRSRRRFPYARGVSVEEFDLTKPRLEHQCLAGVDAVIHLAAIIKEDSRPEGSDEDLNVKGTRALLEAARRQGVRRFVFLSSQSASPTAPTRYGQSKWTIEQLMDGPQEIVVRPGMVSGGPLRGVYGSLLRLAKRFPLLPILRARAPVHPIHIDDLCEALLILATAPGTQPKVVRLAPRASMPFKAYVRRMTRERLGLRVWLAPIPAFLVLFLSRLSERVPFLPTVSQERVKGLLALPRFDFSEPQNEMELQFGQRDPFQALSREGHHRRLILEGNTLMRYLAGNRISLGVIRRFVQAVLAERNSRPMDLPRWIHWRPSLLAFLEPLRGDTLLRQRLSIATRIIEMTPAAAPLFHNYRAGSRIITALSLGWMLGMQTLLFPIRMVIARLKPPRS